jgi:hypothetical protein
MIVDKKRKEKDMMIVTDISHHMLCFCYIFLSNNLAFFMSTNRRLFSFFYDVYKYISSHVMSTKSHVINTFILYTLRLYYFFLCLLI